MIIDMAAHILPEKYKQKLDKIALPTVYNKKINDTLPTLYDIQRRIRIMNRYGELRQVLTISKPSG